MRTIAIIQARMGSTRLPGKVLKPLGGRSVLSQVIRRVGACPGLTEVVVATTTHAEDDAIVAESERCGVETFRGDRDDVLSRYYLAAKAHEASLVVRVTSDCPLFDPTLLGAMLAAYHAGEAPDYLSNTLERRYPRGLDAEIFTFAALERAHREATKPYEREHVTPHLYQHPERFSVRQYAPGGEDHSALRWTLDTPEDFTFLSAVYDVLGPDGASFTTQDVLALLAERPELIALNSHVRQKQLGE